MLERLISLMNVNFNTFNEEDFFNCLLNNTNKNINLEFLLDTDLIDKENFGK